MIINFNDTVNIIKKNFISIILTSIIVSLLTSYLFFNISKSTASKVEILILVTDKKLFGAVPVIS